MTVALPRYVISKPLASGKIAFYFNMPGKLRKIGCTVANEALGTDYETACGKDGQGGRAAVLNGLVDEWDAARKGQPVSSEAAPRIGTIDWLFQEYKSSKAYLEKVSPRSRSDYEKTMKLVSDTLTKQGNRIGSRSIKSVTPLSADKLYEIFLVGKKKGQRPRSAEKAVKLCSKAWRVVRRLHPDEFPKDVPDPWAGVTLKRRVKQTKGAVTREQVYAFAWGCIKLATDEARAAAAAAVICFEWLQRPENVISGYIRWTDYRTDPAKATIRIEHHKTGKQVLHPLEERNQDGELVKFYEEAEDIISRLPRLGVPMIMRRTDDENKTAKPYSLSGFQKIIQRTRKTLKLPAAFTLDACRHGGMTELEEAELTDGQGRALSAHTSKAYDGYAKRTFKRALAATRKRHAHVLAGVSANSEGTGVQNARGNGVQNAKKAAGVKT